MNSKRYPVDLFSFCDIADLALTLTYVPRLTESWMAEFEGAQVKEKEGVVTSVHGSGKTIEEAIENYIDLVQKKTLIAESTLSSPRREVIIPPGLTIEDRV